MFARFLKIFLYSLLILHSLDHSALAAGDKSSGSYSADLLNMPYTDLITLGVKGGVVAAIVIGVKYVIVEGVVFGYQKAGGVESEADLQKQKKQEDLSFKLEKSISDSDKAIALNESTRKSLCAEMKDSPTCQKLYQQQLRLLEQNNQLRERNNKYKLKQMAKSFPQEDIKISMKDLAEKA